MEETLAIELPAALSTRLRHLAQTQALPVEQLVVKTLEATVEGERAVGTLTAITEHQERVFMVLHRLADDAQVRMEELMARNTEGELTAAEETELAALVAEYEQILLTNSQQLLRMQAAGSPGSVARWPQ